jgi:hypothetical protein
MPAEDANEGRYSRVMPALVGAAIALGMCLGGAGAMAWRRPCIVQDSFRPVSQYAWTDRLLRHAWEWLGMYDGTPVKRGSGQYLKLILGSRLAAAHCGLAATGRCWVIVLGACAVYHWCVFPYFIRGAHARCRRCGYLLKGLSVPRCPECGQAI